MNAVLTNNEMLIRIGLIVLLSGLVGLDRELKHKPAGAKTHILVGLGSTIFMLVSIYMFEAFRGQAQVDPGRIAAQVVTGIGFLGAGTIILAGREVLGLTTAASLWAVAGIGLAVGAGMYFLAIVSAITILIVFLVINRLSDVIEKQFGRVKAHIRKIRGKKK